MHATATEFSDGVSRWATVAMGNSFSRLKIAQKLKTAAGLKAAAALQSAASLLVAAIRKGRAGDIGFDGTTPRYKIAAEVCTVMAAVSRVRYGTGRFNGNKPLGEMVALGNSCHV